MRCNGDVLGDLSRWHLHELRCVVHAAGSQDTRRLVSTIKGRCRRMSRSREHECNDPFHAASRGQNMCARLRRREALPVEMDLVCYIHLLRHLHIHVPAETS